MANRKFKKQAKSSNKSAEMEDSGPESSTEAETNPNRKIPTAKNEGSGDASQAPVNPLPPSLPVRITELGPQSSNATIIARVIGKPALRGYQNASGQGQVLNIDLQDGSGQIRGVAFGATAIKWNEAVTVGLAYQISGFTLRSVNEKFKTPNGHPLDMVFNEKSKFDVVGSTGLPNFKPPYTSIGTITQDMAKSTVNVLGIITEVGQVEEFQRQSRDVAKKLTITLLDQSDTSINLTLWEPYCADFAGLKGQAIGLIKVQISAYNGVSLSTNYDTTLLIEPTSEAAAVLKAWYRARH